MHVLGKPMILLYILKGLKERQQKLWLAKDRGAQSVVAPMARCGLGFTTSANELPRSSKWASDTFRMNWIKSGDDKAWWQTVQENEFSPREILIWRNWWMPHGLLHSMQYDTRKVCPQVLGLGTLAHLRGDFSVRRHTTFRQRISSLWDSMKKWIEGLPTDTEEVRVIIYLLKAGQIQAACDGLTWQGWNAFEICLGVHPDPKRWTTSNEMPGLPIAPDSLELCRILATMEYLSLLAEW